MNVVPAEGAVLDEILAATYDIWHEGLTRDAYPRYYKGQLATAWARRNLRRWALVDEGRVLASAKVYALDAVLDKRDVRVFGIGALFTQPAHCGHSHARTLVEWLLRDAVTEGFDLALLFSEIGAAYYERFGFRRVDAIELQIRVREDPVRGAPAMLVRAGDDRDLADIVTVDADRGAPFRFRLRRSRELVEYGLVKKRLLAGLSASGRRAVEFFVAEEGGSAAAYVLLTTSATRWTIEEAGDRDPTGARLGAILQTLIAREPSVPRPTIVGWLPDSLRPPQLDIVDQRAASDVMMVKPLTVDGTPQPPLGRGDFTYWHGDLF